MTMYVRAGNFLSFLFWVSCPFWLSLVDSFPFLALIKKSTSLLKSILYGVNELRMLKDETV